MQKNRQTSHNLQQHQLEQVDQLEALLGVES
jgi:hypothetical protein